MTCGICDRPIVTQDNPVNWASESGPHAHASCRETIAVCEDRLTQAIKAVASGLNPNLAHDQAHIAAVKAIKATFPDQSILAYFKQEGADKLAEIFYKKGAGAVYNMATHAKL